MKKQAFSHTNNCVFSLTYHMVLVVKRRRPVLTGPMIDDAREIARLRCEARSGRLIELGGEVDTSTSCSSFRRRKACRTSRMRLRRMCPGSCVGTTRTCAGLVRRSGRRAISSAVVGVGAWKQSRSTSGRRRDRTDPAIPTGSPTNPAGWKGLVARFWVMRGAIGTVAPD